jgi:hypothetical protein
MPLLLTVVVDLVLYLPVKFIHPCTARLGDTELIPFIDLSDGASGDVVVHVGDASLGNELLGGLEDDFPLGLFTFDGIGW